MITRMMAVSTMMILAVGPAQAAPEVFKEGAFLVKKVDGGCKLEASLRSSDLKPAAKETTDEVMGILALFSSDKFYSELFTNRKRVGQAQKNLKVAFDGGKPVEYPFAAQPGSDDHWRWQYLDHINGLLDGIGSKKTMNVEISNGKETFRFELPLAKGGAKAVAALKKCK